MLQEPYPSSTLAFAHDVVEGDGKSPKRWAAVVQNCTSQPPLPFVDQEFLEGTARAAQDQLGALDVNASVKAVGIPGSINEKDHPLPLRTPRPATEPRNGLTRNFHEKYEKIPPGSKFWTHRIYPQNTPKIPKKYPPKYQKCAFLVFFRYFLGIFGVF